MPQYQRMSSLDELLMLLDHQMVRDQIRKISSGASHPGLGLFGEDEETAARHSDDNIDDTNITDDFVHVVLLPVKKETFVQKQRRTGRVDGGMQDTQCLRQMSLDELVDIIDHQMVRNDPVKQGNTGDLEINDFVNSNDPSKHPQYERLSSLDEILSLLDHNMVRDQIRKISSTVTPQAGHVPSDEEIIGGSAMDFESGDDSKNEEDKSDVIDEPSIPKEQIEKKNKDKQRKFVTFDTTEHATERTLSNQYEVESNDNSAGTSKEVTRRKVTPGVTKNVSSPISSDSKHSSHKKHSFLNDFLALLRSNVLVRERIRKISEQNVGKFPLSDDILEEGCVETLKMERITEKDTKAYNSEATESSNDLIISERERIHNYK